MRFAFSAEEEAFRAEVVEFLADYRDLDAFFLQGHKWEKVREFFRAMGRRGWLSIGWPQEAGGAGAPPAGRPAGKEEDGPGRRRPGGTLFS